MHIWKRRATLGALSALLFAALTTLIFNTRALGAPAARSTIPGWSQALPVPLGTGDLYGVYMIDANNAWIVGAQGAQGGVLLKYEYRDGSWHVAATSIYDFALRSVVAVSPTDLYAVGDTDAVLHITVNGTAIGTSRMPEPVAGARLLTIQMLGSGEEGWAAGYISVNNNTPYSFQSVLLHYTGGSWKQDKSIDNPAPIASLHFAQGTGWAVGNGLWRYSKGGWTQEQEPQVCPDNNGCYPGFSGVRAVSSTEAWAVGSYERICGICVDQRYIAHWTGSSWQNAFPFTGPPNAIHSTYRSILMSISFSSSDFGIAVGSYEHNATQEPAPDFDYALSYRGGTWYEESLPQIKGTLNAISIIDEANAMAVGSNGTILSFNTNSEPIPQPSPPPSVPPSAAPSTAPTAPAQLTPGATPGITPGPSYPTAPVADPKDASVLYFPQVGHTLRDGFRNYWQSQGGLAQFGYPVTEEFQEASVTNGKTYRVQYFQRARFEYHPENKAPYDVLLGLLGRTVTQGREGEAPFKPVAAQTNPDSLFFAATGHNIYPQFVSYWQTHGSLPVYGYPISEPFTETSPTDGKPYTVQYFERNRFEYHPELPLQYRVSLGLLGAQVVFGK